jgi:hypothetical protein
MNIIARSRMLGDDFKWSGLVDGQSYEVVEKVKNGFRIKVQSGDVRWFHYMFFGMSQRAFESNKLS